MPRGKRGGSPELRPVESSNDLNDEQKAKLFVTGITRLERLVERKDSAVADIRSHRKTMKSEGFSREEVEFALKLRKDGGQDAAKDLMALQIRIAEWLGHPVGFQASLDLEAAQ